MSSDRKIAEFPDVENKLQAPTKKSLFERQKAEAEAKRQREEAETKAVYDDFVKSFDDEEVNPHGSGGGGGGYGGFSAPPPVRRNFGGGGGGGFTNNSSPAGPAFGRAFGGGSSGRGGSGPGSLGPPPQSLNKKRAFDGFQQQPSRRDDRGLLAFDDYEHEREKEPKRVFHTSDSEEEDKKVAMDRGEEKAGAKPTLRLASLPPGTSPAFIKTLIPSTLTVDSVRILPPSGPGNGLERKSMSAIVTLAKDTPANELDSTVNGLQNKYLGYGYYLNLHRHLSSAAISSAPIPALGTGSTSHPFGAKPVSIAPQAGRGPPHQHGRGFAPPTSYGPPPPRGAPNPNTPLLHVPVQPPQSITQLKLIHKTIESLLTHGPEFEALLMTRPSVQRSESWAWIWDPRSVGGVWYRWRLWSMLTRSSSGGKYLPLFENSHAWKAPEKDLAWEFTTKLEEFIDESEYNSSDEDDSDAEATRKPAVHGTGGPPDPSSLLAADEGISYLNPLSKAKLTHLLARVPTSTARLRKGDVARVTAFAISHAGRGADEVVSLLISNVEKPFAFTSANPSRSSTKDAAEEDSSSAQLAALYLISDILSSSSTSGVRHAWRYRSLFESALKRSQTFEKLGRLERKLKWGRLRAEKWKRSVGGLLSLWEGWCVFPQDSQDHFTKNFNDPPKTEAEVLEEKRLEAERGAEKSRSSKKWKAVEVEATTPTSVSAFEPAGKKEEEDDDDDEDSQDHFTKNFNDPPKTEAEVLEEKRLEAERGAEKSRSSKKWKAVEVEATTPTSVSAFEPAGKKEEEDDDDDDENVDGEPMEDDDDEDVDGEPMAEDDEDLDGVPMVDDDDYDQDVDGEPMAVDDEPTQGVAEPPHTTATAITEEPEQKMKVEAGAPPLAGRARKPRARAVDMFADSDDDE